jgi:hypothetical protein
MRRKRVLSDQGLKLLSSAYNPPEYDSSSVKVGCVRTFIKQLFTSDYDRQLKECVSMFRQGSETLVSSSNDDIPLSKACGNAMDNVLLLILTEREKPASLFTTKRNVRWFMDVALKSMETKDDNTAILLRAVLTHSCIQRLNVMTKNMHGKLKRLEDRYGNFVSCQAEHVKHVLKQDTTTFGPGRAIPSFMTLDMYLKRNKEHRKAFVNIGKMPTSLLKLEHQLSSLMSILHERFKSKQPLIPLYSEDPEINNVFLYNIVNAIVPSKTRKKILRQK